MIREYYNHYNTHGTVRQDLRQTVPFAKTCLTLNVSRTDVLPSVTLSSIAESAYIACFVPTALPIKICHQEPGENTSEKATSELDHSKYAYIFMLDCPEI